MSSVILIYSLVLANSDQVLVFDIELKFPPAKFMTGVASGKSICRFFCLEFHPLPFPAILAFTLVCLRQLMCRR